MDCGKIRGMLAAYLEGEDTPAQRRLVQEHLSSCAKCRCTAEDLKKTRVLLKNLEEIEPPPWLTQKVMARVRDEAEHKSGVLKWLFYPLHTKLPLQGIAAILIVGLAAFLYKAMAPQFEAAKAPRKEQVVQPEDRMATARREEAFSRQSASAAKDARQDREAPEEAAKPSSAGAQKQAYAERSAAIQDRSTQFLRQGSSAPRSEESQPAYAPLQQPDQPWPASPQGASVRPRLKAKAPAPRSGGVIESKSGQVDLTVRVTDVADAAKRIERLLYEEGASRVTRESRGWEEILSVEMKSEQVDALLQKLRSIGDTRGSPPDVRAGETVAVRIDLQHRSVADEGVR